MSEWLQQRTCRHKFVDSKSCLKCGWTPCDSRSPKDGFPCTLEKGHIGPHTALGVHEPAPEAERRRKPEDCNAEHDGYVCNIPKGHAGPHQAYAGADLLCAEWTVKLTPPACPSCTALRQQLAQLDDKVFRTTADNSHLLSELASLRQQLAQAQQERDEAKSHSAKCATCGKWSCGFCGVSDGKGNWTCELCWGVGPLAEATKRAEAAESRLREVTQERDALKEQPMDKQTEALLMNIAGFLTLITTGVVTVQQPFVKPQAEELLEKIGAALADPAEAEATRDTPTEPTT